MSQPARSGTSGGSPPELAGSPVPRIAVPEPARDLTPDTSYGFDVIAFARDVLREPLLPWEEHVAMRVLEIDKASGLPRFRKAVIMAGRQNGKSRTASVIALWRMLQFARPQLILGTAQDIAQASYAWNLTLQLAKGCPWLLRQLAFDRHVNGQESFGFANGSEYKIRASNEAAGRGLSVDMLLLDKLKTHRDWGAFGAQVSTTLARPGSQVVGMSNAGNASSVVLSHLRSVALAGSDEQLLWLKWSAPDGCDTDDPRAWAMANPALGHLITAASLRSMHDSTPAALFRTENLCQFVSVTDTAVDPAAWIACADQAGTLESARGRICACFDSAPDGQHAALAIAAQLSDGRVHAGLAGYWDTVAEARGALPALLDEFQPVALGWYPPSEIAPVLRARPGSTELKGGTVTEACMGLASLVDARGLTHPGDPLLDAHIGRAEKLPSGNGWKFGGRRINCAYALAGAVHLALSDEPPARARIRILSW